MAVDEFDPLITSVARQASTGQILRLPWHTRPIALGSFFNTKTASTSKVDPFSRDSAFDTEAVRKSRINFEPFDGDASYKSSESTSSSSSADHLSVGVGASKTSVMTTYRAGSVTFSRPPKLSEAALQTIKYNGGLSAFKQRWGDYYVAGYRIGGDAGVMMSLGSSSKTVSESVTVCIKVEILFFSFEDSWSKSWSSAESDLRVTLSCFSTVEQAKIQEQRQLGDPKLYSLIQEARGIHNRAQGLVDTVQRKLDQLGVSNDKHVTIEQCVGLWSCSIGKPTRM
ncbi:hypothetical protein HG530_001629 [Fusarium avenaceum]|nr:hypothetical protein HG530_001629 [Fusarium avenaceum]